jgi:hypothetical protein
VFKKNILGCDHAALGEVHVKHLPMPADPGSACMVVLSATARNGPTVKCALDPKRYPKRIKVTEEEFQRVNIIRDDFDGEWKYMMPPNSH